MTYQVNIGGASNFRSLIETVRAAATSALENQQETPGGLTVILTGEDEVRRLNRLFADQDASTDVLSFPDGETDPDTDRLYFGDVVIAVPIAERQAERAGHSLEAEIALLTVHGVLHLLGFDHADPERKGQMWQAQDRVLQRLGFEIPLPAENP